MHVQIDLIVGERFAFWKERSLVSWVVVICWFVGPVNTCDNAFSCGEYAVSHFAILFNQKVSFEFEVVFVVMIFDGDSSAQASSSV